MGFIRNAIIGIAIFEGIKYLTKKDVLGTSNFEKIKEQVPEYIEKAKVATEDIRAGRLPQV
ncbi:YtxH domain-containing protein [Pedobacter frigidisoli]|uniref:YtxH domain-containing protein n=1 Tax=Pedobacter frigidisoli TaxID=2530455 RepID=UPI00292D246A|nr:YtxH domain-containing protein [Pedobacter frigidisoli]